MIIPFFQRVDKPWGYEFIFTPAGAPTTAKMLHLNALCRFSLQYHEQKVETLILVKGRAKIFFGSDKDNLTEEEMVPNKGYYIQKKMVHRLQAITDCDVFESSTSEAGTTVRLEDDYKRGNETEEERKQARN